MKNPLIVDGIFECLHCGEKLTIPSTTTLSNILSLHREPCEIKTRTVMYKKLWTKATDELDGLKDLEGSIVDARRTFLKEIRREYKKALDFPKIIKEEVEARRKLLAGADERESNEWIEGELVRVTRTPKDLLSNHWEWHNGAWRRAENLADGTKIWAEYPSTLDGKRPNPHADSVSYYPRLESQKQLNEKIDGI